MNSESTSQKNSRHCRKIKHIAVFKTQVIVNFIRLGTAIWVCHQVFSQLLAKIMSGKQLTNVKNVAYNSIHVIASEDAIFIIA